MVRPLVLASSHGGHLELLEALIPAFAGRPRVWLTPRSPQADALVRRGEQVLELLDPQRSAGRLGRNVRQAGRRLRDIQPGAVLSTGSGTTVPLCLLARARRVPLIWIETMARTQDASASGRVAYRISDRFFVQWRSLQPVFPRACVCRPALLEGARTAPISAGRGTLIACGTHDRPFDRLLRLADEAVGSGVLPPPVVAQGISSAPLRHIQPHAALPPAAIRAAVEQSEVVLTHGGSGIIAQALRCGRMPIVLPRRRAADEHHDDHQVAMTDQMDRLGLVASLDRRPLESALSLMRQGPRTDALAALEGPRLVCAVHEALDDLLR